MGTLNFQAKCMLALCGAMVFSSPVRANEFADYMISDGEIRQRCQANIGTPVDTIKVGNRSASACVTAWQRMRDLGMEYEAARVREGKQVGDVVTGSLTCNAGTSQTQCFDQQGKMYSRAATSNRNMASILGDSRQQVGEIKRATDQAIRQYNEDYRKITGSPYKQVEDRRSAISGLHKSSDGKYYRQSVTFDGNELVKLDDPDSPYKDDKLGRVKDPAIADKYPSKTDPPPTRPLSPSSGNASTLPQYQAKIPRLIDEQLRASKAAEQFDSTAASREMGHQMQAQQMQQKQQETMQARKSIDSKTENPQAAARREQEPAPKGASDSQDGLKTVEGKKSGKLAGKKKDSDFSFDRSPASSAAVDLSREKPASGGQRSASEISSSSDGVIAPTPAARLKSAKDRLREQLARKKSAGAKLSPIEEAFLNGDADIMELAAAGDRKSDKEIEDELRALFGMNGVETDAYIKEAMDAFVRGSQGALLDAESEMLFIRVHKAHQRFASREP